MPVRRGLRLSTERAAQRGPEAGGIYWSYGAHNLSGQYGNHFVVNDQTGGAGYKLCFQYNGGDCIGTVRQVGWVDDDLTPINSNVLVR